MQSRTRQRHRPRIAFTNIQSARWTAGRSYLRNLFIALRSLEKNIQPEIILLADQPAISDSHADFGNYVNDIVEYPSESSLRHFYRRKMSGLAARFKFLGQPEPPVSKFLRQINIDALFAHGTEGSGFKLPLLSWIPDFQHIHKPSFFKPEDIQRRNTTFNKMAINATRVILSSKDSLSDFSNFAPFATDKARVMSFVAQIPVEVFDKNPDWICDRYHLPEKFFFLPNQFWKHKNHLTVIQAIAIARSKHPEITVVCTGNTNEYRHPLYFSELLEQISTMGLRNNFLILGLLPKQHIYHLMRQSLAVLQPSFFEGWSTTVEEVKSIGKKIMLSDIAVHHEQNPPKATYFDPNNSELLAKLLVKAHCEFTHGPDNKLELLARQNLRQRTIEFGECFMKIASEI